MRAPRKALFIALMLLMAFLQSPLAIIPQVKADSTTFYPIDDCSLDSNNPDNTDDGAGLYVGSGSSGVPLPRYSFLMKFDLSSLEGKNITSAKFRLYVYARAGSKSFYIRKIANDTWFEELTTYNNKPDAGDVIYIGSCGEGPGWVEHIYADITTYVDEEKGGELSVYYVAAGTYYYQHYNFYRSKDYNGGSLKPELVIEWEEYPLSPVTHLFGAGFNGSTPVVDLYWNWNDNDVTLFEVQNSTDKISWDYLGSNTTAEYHDFEVVNGTERYYRVRACNFTDAWDNSTWSDIDFEKVYFIMDAAGVGDTIIMGAAGVFWIILIIIVPIVAYVLKKG